VAADEAQQNWWLINSGMTKMYYLVSCAGFLVIPDLLLKPFPCPKTAGDVSSALVPFPEIR
jgi:hypothetical protein